MPKFREIEHKFLLTEGQVSSLKERIMVFFSYPLKRIRHFDSTEHYYTLKNNNSHVYRHRASSDLDELTVKSLQDDTESRLEVNLRLEHGVNQVDVVKELLNTMSGGVDGYWGIRKAGTVYIFAEYSVSVYSASFLGKTLHCAEIEPNDDLDEKDSLFIIDVVEKELDLHPLNRCKKSVFQMLRG